MIARYATVVFDADSTLSAIEGIDWLANQKGPELGERIAQLTARAMSGELPLEAVYGARLDVIKPTLSDIAALSEAYIAAVEPGGQQLIARLKAINVRVLIVSGGLRAALLPLANYLGVAGADVHAVDMTFDNNNVFASVAPSQQLTHQTGKPELIARLIETMAVSRPLAMIGDGSTDAAVASVADAFIAYTGVARRVSVVNAAQAEAANFDALAPLLFAHE